VLSTFLVRPILRSLPLGIRRGRALPNLIQAGDELQRGKSQADRPRDVLANDASHDQLMVAKNEGLDNAEPRTPQSTTPTSFRRWGEEVLKPAVLS
jgi:hypothetical protein